VQFFVIIFQETRSHGMEFEICIYCAKDISYLRCFSLESQSFS